MKDSSIARAYALCAFEGENGEKDVDTLSLLNALRALAVEAGPPGRRSSVESTVYDAAARYVQPLSFPNMRSYVSERAHNKVLGSSFVGVVHYKRHLG